MTFIWEQGGRQGGCAATQPKDNEKVLWLHIQNAGFLNQKLGWVEGEGEDGHNLCLRLLLRPYQAPAFPRESQSLLTVMKPEEALAGFTVCSVDKIMVPLKL